MTEGWDARRIMEQLTEIRNDRSHVTRDLMAAAVEQAVAGEMSPETLYLVLLARGREIGIAETTHGEMHAGDTPECPWCIDEEERATLKEDI